MRSVEPGDPMWPHVMRQHAKMMAARARLLMPGWPVFAPVEQGAGLTLSEFGQSNGDTTFIEIAVMGAGNGPQITVRSQMPGVEVIQPLADVLADRADRAAGRPRGPNGFPEVSSDAVLPPAPDAEPVLVWVDGIRHRAVRQQHGRFTAWQMVVNQVAVTVVAQDADPNDLGLVRLLDLSDLVNRTEREYRPANRLDWRDRRAWAAPPDQSEPLWAHRGVVALTVAAHQGERSGADRPRRSWDQDWGLWWEAARDQQMSRTGQTRSAAMDSVGVMANQLGELSRTADWWTNEPVRQAAIAQVIWYTVTGDDSVSSAAAQQLWVQSQPPTDLGGFVQGSNFDAEQFLALARTSDDARVRWNRAWQLWADRQQQSRDD